ncbi:IclR family transcriptional regulator [Ruania alkalisoli]|uniref:IclR family transcriptional regulator n=1 Tax=Ruania alkalisoli TaxID=2779775 RepID=A0A7M1SW95_9MICO|nr:IclR family transcriptional regulator [Ruania alkalisoli]QOR71815.1 IclR family transcriptional regulator [Ruania alkalisoli]
MTQETRLVGTDRVLAVLIELAEHPHGVTLDELSRRVDSAKPTVHRALAALRRQRLAIQDGHGRYLLGDEFLRLAFAHHEQRPEHVRIAPALDELCRRFAETVHYAVLDGRDVVYRAKVDPPTGAMRISSVIGGRNPAHATGVGKLLLAERLTSMSEIVDWIGDVPLARPTDHTLTTPADLHAEFEQIRAQGFAVDDQENEPGIACLAVPASSSPSRYRGAISISALAHRTPLSTLIADVETIRAIVARGSDRPEEED